jgi:hypothetical protein
MPVAQQAEILGAEVANDRTEGSRRQLLSAADADAGLQWIMGRARAADMRGIADAENVDLDALDHVGQALIRRKLRQSQLPVHMEADAHPFRRLVVFIDDAVVDRADIIERSRKTLRGHQRGLDFGRAESCRIGARLLRHC